MMKYLYEIQQAVRELLEDGYIITHQNSYTCNEIAFMVKKKYNDSFSVHVDVKTTLSEISRPFILAVYEKAVSGEIELSERAIGVLKENIEIKYYRGAFIHDISTRDDEKTDSELFAEYRRQWLEFILTQENRRNA